MFVHWKSNILKKKILLINIKEIEKKEDSTSPRGTEWTFLASPTSDCASPRHWASGFFEPWLPLMTLHGSFKISLLSAPSNSSLDHSTLASCMLPGEPIAVSRNVAFSPTTACSVTLYSLFAIKIVSRVFYWGHNFYVGSVSSPYGLRDLWNLLEGSNSSCNISHRAGIFFSHPT